MSDPFSTGTSSLGRLAVALGRQWWPQVAALAAACAVVATTIGGALAVGSALQRGLESLALGRLGRIDAAVVGQTFFTAGLGERLAAAAAEGDGPRHLVPAIVMPVTVSAGRGGTMRATLLACDDPAALGYEPAPPPLAADAALVNGPLAAAVALAAGDQLVVRLPRRSSVPADSPLGRRTGSSDGRRLTVAAVLPDRGLGRFAVRPVQTTEPLIVVPLETAQRILRRPGAANAIFAVGMPGGEDAAAWLADHLQPTLADYGLALEPATPASLRLTTDRLILPPEVDAAAAATLAPRGGQPTLVLLANAIAPPPAAGRPAASVPYSTVLGIEATALPVGDLVADDGSPLPTPPDDGLIINRWLADDLAAQGRPVAVGDSLRLDYFEPETVHGRVVETTAELRITGIAAMTGLATAREVVPEVEGVTDEESIADWDPPFPFEAARVRTSPPKDEDDRYWKTYRATPKAFVTLATARRLAGSRFGRSTAWLVPRPADLDPEPLAAELAAELAAALPPASLGLTVAPLLADALAASRGSTPFGSLFLALSSFVVAAGLLLEWLLFGLLVAAHRRDLGILAAVGWPPRRLTELLVAVGGLAAVIGGLAGTLLAAPWARLLMRALGSRWTSQVEPGSGADFFTAPPAPAALVAGGTAAVAVSLVALALAARRAAAIPPLALLQASDPPAARRRRRRLPLAIAAVGLTAALATALLARGGSAEVEVAAFFGAGLVALAGLLAVVWLWLSAAPSRLAVRTLAGLARRNLAFAATRAFSVAAIVATATFLIVAVSSFAQRPPADPTDRTGPTGGWTEFVAFGEPTGVDPADPAGGSSLGLSSDQEQLVSGCEIARLRSSGRDDAACTNLYATLQPTIIGVGPGFIARGGFSFAAHASLTGADQAAAANPWQLLDRQTAGGPIPAILDQATAQWALTLGGLGSVFTLADDAGEPIDFEIVGLLEPGILQGFVIVAEREFERVFPAASGYRLALVDASGLPADRRGEVPAALAAAWADAGTTVTPAIRRLASLQAVQNTFLAGFQALGTLGLLLGTVGVAAVLLQGTFERLGPLAVLRALGFTPARVRGMLVLETVLMVVLGLAAGTTAALVAVAPALAGGQARLPVAWIAITSGLALAAAVAAATAAASQAVIPHRPPAAE